MAGVVPAGTSLKVMLPRTGSCQLISMVLGTEEVMKVDPGRTALKRPPA
jgi:hypothetical protein